MVRHSFCIDMGYSGMGWAAEQVVTGLPPAHTGMHQQQCLVRFRPRIGDSQIQLAAALIQHTLQPALQLVRQLSVLGQGGFTAQGQLRKGAPEHVLSEAFSESREGHGKGFMSAPAVLGAVRDGVHVQSFQSMDGLCQLADFQSEMVLETTGREVFQ